MKEIVIFVIWFHPANCSDWQFQLTSSETLNTRFVPQRDKNFTGDKSLGRSQWPRCLRSRHAAAYWLGLWLRIPPGAWMSVSCDCCVLCGRGRCD